MNMLIAHRGLKSNCAENTMCAFKNALKNNQYGGLECDIRTSKDAIFVIHHSPLYHLKRIANTPYSKMSELPTLTELLKLNSDKIFLLEIKENNIDCQKLHNLLEKYSSKKIYVMSFHNQVIKKLASFNHSYKLGCLNYVLNSENNYEHYDFICLLESVYTEQLKNYFQTKNKEIFLYAIHKESSYSLKNIYFITDKIIE